MQVNLDDDDAALLGKLLRALRGNLSNDAMMEAPATMFELYLAAFVYGNITTGATSAERAYHGQLIEDLRRLEHIFP